MSAIPGASKQPLRSAYLVINPVAGRGDAVLDLADIREAMGPDIDLNVLPTKAERETREQVREVFSSLGIPDGSSPNHLFLAAGGDGTISEVAGVLMGTGVPLGVIPRGTANAFARGLGIPFNLKKACEVIARGKTRAVDAVQGTKGPMVLIAEVGIGADMIAAAERSEKQRLGSMAYLAAGLRQLAEQEPFTARIQADEQSLELELTALTVANVAPAISVLAQGCGEVLTDDGKLELTLVAGTELGLSHLASLVASAIGSSESGSENIICLRASRVRVETDPPKTVVVDGEDRGETPFELECLPRALHVFVP